MQVLLTAVLMSRATLSALRLRFPMKLTYIAASIFRRFANAVRTTGMLLQVLGPELTHRLYAAVRPLDQDGGLRWAGMQCVRNVLMWG